MTAYEELLPSVWLIMEDNIPIVYVSTEEEAKTKIAKLQTKQEQEAKAEHTAYRNECCDEIIADANTACLPEYKPEAIRSFLAKWEHDDQSVEFLTDNGWKILAWRKYSYIQIPKL